MRRLSLLVILLAGCGHPIDAIRSVEPRSGGGATITGEHDYYDSLGEHEHIYLTSVALDADGHVQERNDLGENNSWTPPARKPSPHFGDGAQLDLLPVDSSSSAPQVARGLDPNGVELWRVALPLERVSDWSEDSDGAVILGGAPQQPASGWIDGGLALKIEPDGSIAWQVTLR